MISFLVLAIGFWDKNTGICAGAMPPGFPDHYLGSAVGYGRGEGCPHVYDH